MAYNYKLTIGYDGARYQGWQKNKNAKDTIQNKLEKTISEVVGETVSLIGSGRTDKGVHASHQVANFTIKNKHKSSELKAALNALLPDDIVIQEVNKVDLDFHSRFSAKSKTYRYTLWKADANHRPLFERKFVYALEEVVDIDRMLIAADLFLGEHDFKGFCSDKTKKSTVRVIESIDIIEDDDFIEIEVKANGFLYNMVRIMVGTLIEIGTGQLYDSAITDVFNSGDRSKAGFTAPAKGLCLIDVDYE